MKAPFMAAAAGLLALALAAGAETVATTPAGQAKPTPEQIEQVLQDMTAGVGFREEKLLALGAPGLEAVLDRLVPVSARLAKPPPGTTDKQIRDLIRRLGSADWQEHEAATKKLVELGKSIAGYLVLAAASDGNPRVRKRAGHILGALGVPLPVDASRSARAFWKYAWKLKDKQTLDVMAARVLTALARGMPPPGQAEILKSCVGALGRSGNDEYSKMLLPLLKHEDERVAVLVTKGIRLSPTNNAYFPPLLLAALASDRERVVHAAISHAPNCWDAPRKPQLKRLLLHIFEGKNEKLKFHVCFPLMHDFHHPKAMEYLLSQAQRKDDKKRAIRAIGWVGDSCNHHNAVTAAHLKALTPWLRSPDNDFRRAAVNALATYSGEAVVRALIPMLADREGIIAAEARRLLPDQRDKEMVKRLLAGAARTHEKQTVRAAAGKLLAELKAKEKPPTGTSPPTS